MTRQLISTDTLLEVMNRELARHDTCIKCRFKSIMPLRDTDEYGCNWSHANLNCSGFPAAVDGSAAICQPATYCQPVAARLIAEAKGKYNVW